MKDSQHKSALHVNPGVEQPESINDEGAKFIRDKRKKKLEADNFVDGILSGDRTILSQAITLIESTLPEHQTVARQIIESCLPSSGKSKRIGITGVPGVGKSTFIETLGKLITSKGHKLAVLAIDPSSEKTKGSILGDKTRMEDLANDPNAYIRPSPSSGTLGGVARHTREAIILCEAAGFDIIFIETVGVGQSETMVHSMVDFFLLLMLAGAGDELQGIKRGIMEMADIIAINKADGTNNKKAEIAAIGYRQAIHLFPPTESGWMPEVVTCSAIAKTGIAELWDLMNDYFAMTMQNNYFESHRKSQSKYWMYESIYDQLKEKFHNHPQIKFKITETEQRVLSGEISSVTAANMLLEMFR